MRQDFILLWLLLAMTCWTLTVSMLTRSFLQRTVLTTRQMTAAAAVAPDAGPAVAPALNLEKGQGQGRESRQQNPATVEQQAFGLAAGSLASETAVPPLFPRTWSK